MNYQPINFAGIAPLGLPGVRDLVANAVAGYKAAQVPGDIAHQKQMDKMKETMAAFEMQEHPQKFKAEMALNSAKAAQANAAANKAKSIFDFINGGSVGGKSGNNNPQPPTQVPFRLPGPQGNEQQNQGFTSQGQGQGQGQVSGMPGGNLNNFRDQVKLNQAFGVPFTQPGYETPAQKRANDLKVYQQKQALEQESKGGGNVASVERAAIQKANRKTDDLLSLIEDMQDTHTPGQYFSKYIHPNYQSQYNDKQAKVLDLYLGAKQLPSSDGAIAEVKKIFNFQPNETQENWFNRLNSTAQDLLGTKYRNLKRIGKNLSPREMERYYKGLTESQRDELKGEL